MIHHDTTQKELARCEFPFLDMANVALIEFGLLQNSSCLVSCVKILAQSLVDAGTAIVGLYKAVLMGYLYSYGPWPFTNYRYLELVINLWDYTNSY
jgi:hypothetical protein